MAEERGQHPEVLSEMPAPFSVLDYVQLASMTGHSVRIYLGKYGQPHAGVLTMHSGKLWSASDGEGNGEEAFKRMVFKAFQRFNGGVRCVALTGSAGPRNITTDSTRLLLEAACSLDEARQNGGPQAEVIEMPSIKKRPSLELLLDQGLDALLSRDYAKALDAFSKAKDINPEHPQVTTNLKRLAELGYTQKGGRDD